MAITEAFGGKEMFTVCIYKVHVAPVFQTFDVVPFIQSFARGRLSCLTHSAVSEEPFKDVCS